MKKFIFIILIIFVYIINLYAQPVSGGGTCATAAPLCTDYAYDFPLQTNTNAEAGPDYDCLGSQPNPAWYYLQISQAGDINMDLHAANDVDFIIWGPFNSVTCDYSDLSSGNVVDCSFSASAQEWPSIPNAQVGEIYMYLITNYANVGQNFNLTQSSGSGATDCSIVNPQCSVDAGIDQTICLGGFTDIQATASVQNVVGGYTFTWSPTGTLVNDSTQTVQVNSPSQTYTVTLNTSDGCTDTDDITITTVELLINPIVVTNDACGYGNGSATVTMQNGLAPYTFDIGSTSNSTGSFSNLTANTYNVTITDANGCTATDQFTILDAGSITASFTQPANQCLAGNSFSFDASSSTTTSNPTYSWDFGDTYIGTGVTTTHSYSSASTFTVTLTITDGTCSDAISYDITVDPMPSANAGIDDLICGLSYNLNATVSSGTGTWTQISGSGTSNFSNINLSSSQVTVSQEGAYTFQWEENNNGCIDNDQVVINFWQIPTPNAGIDDIICGNDYTLNSTASIGTGVWTTTSNATILNPNQNNSGTTVNIFGTYTYTWTENNNGCIASDDVDITYNLIPNSNFTVSQINCFGDNSTVTYIGNASSSATYTWDWGSGNATPGSGQGPNNVNWAIANTNTISLQVTENGCQSAITTHDIVNPELLTSNATSTDILCFGDANGTLTATYQGGTFPFTTIWNTGDSTLNVSNLNGGNYQIVITDAMGCISTSTTTVNEPQKIVLSPIENFFVCDGGSVNAQASVIGGTPNYIYYWDGVQSSSASYNENPVISNSSHCVKVIDQNNCTDSTCFTISVSEPVILQLYANTDSVCPNDPILVTASISGGIGPPYMVTDYNTGDVVSPPMIINPTEDGSITMVVEDGCGSKDTSTVKVNLYPLPANSFESDIQSGCQALQVTFNENNSQNGQTYIWDFGDNSTDNLSLSKNPIHTYNYSGIFNVTLTVTSDKGCKNIVTIPNYINVFPKPNAKFLFKPSVATIIKPNVTFENLSTLISSTLWDFDDGDSSSLINPTHIFPSLYPGEYNVKLIVMSVYGCKDTAVSIVPVKPVPTFYAPTGFSPNNDRINDKFFVTGIGIDPDRFTLKIYDRWGEVIWETKIFYTEDGISEEWNGFVKHNKICQNGIYKWVVVYYDTDGTQHETSGTVNIIR